MHLELVGGSESDSVKRNMTRGEWAEPVPLTQSAAGKGAMPLLAGAGERAAHVRSQSPLFAGGDRSLA